jgi:hypothetical protein
MKPWSVLTTLSVALALSVPASTWAGGSGYGRWKEGKEEYWNGPCRVKIESKRNEYKKEVKCEDGFAPVAHAPWKEEYRDGNCRVKREAKHDEFKEEIKCR